MQPSPASFHCFPKLHLQVVVIIVKRTHTALIDKYDMYHGGFIWDFIDQALYVKDEVTGKEVLRYGGDFDDRPSDYEFSGDGIVFANRVEKPAMQEVRYYYGLYR